MIEARLAAVQAQVGDHYDELDPLYRDLWGEHVHHGLWRTGRESVEEAVAALSDLVAAELAFAPGDALIDIGCGYGATARRFASAGAKVTGVTLSGGQLAHAPERAGVTLYQQDWLTNTFGDAAFDGAYAIESSEHMPDKPLFFTQARRVLKPGSRLVVCAWLAEESPRDWTRRHLLVPICEEGSLPSMGSASDYEAMARAAGFSVARYQDISGAVARTCSICLRRFLAAFAMRADVRRIALQGRHRRFALSLPRLILAYRIGAMHYGVFTLVAN